MTLLTGGLLVRIQPEEPIFQQLAAIGFVINLLLLTIRLEPEGTFFAND